MAVVGCRDFEECFVSKKCYFVCKESCSLCVELNDRSQVQQHIPRVAQMVHEDVFILVTFKVTRVALESRGLLLLLSGRSGDQFSVCLLAQVTERTVLLVTHADADLADQLWASMNLRCWMRAFVAVAFVPEMLLCSISLLQPVGLTTHFTTQHKSREAKDCAGFSAGPSTTGNTTRSDSSDQESAGSGLLRTCIQVIE